MSQKIVLYNLALLLFFSFYGLNYICVSIGIIILLFGISIPYSGLRAFNAFFGLFFSTIISCAVGYGNDEFLILKDIYYLLIPLIFFSVGIISCNLIPYKKLIKLIVYSGVVSSLLICYETIRIFGLSAISNPFAARYLIGDQGNAVGNCLPSVAIAVILFLKLFKIDYLDKKVTNLILFLNCLGLYMFASRTYFLVLLCFVIILLIYKYKLTKIVLGMLMFIGAILIIQNFFTNFSSESFLGKIFSSISEITISKYDTDEDINTKYRGYESFMAWEQYKSSDWHNKILGNVGVQIDLGLYINLGGQDMRYLPVLHNGYLYIILKTGLLGLTIYVYLFSYLIVKSLSILKNRYNSIELHFGSSLLIGCLFSIITTNYVISTINNLHMAVLMVLVGYFYAFVKQAR